MRNLEKKYPNKLRELRTQLGLTQKEVALLLNLKSENRLCRWEQGQSYPSISHLKKLLEIYKISFEQLYS
jgi:transcriptional regulator with XRE-family HTH domain